MTKKATVSLQGASETAIEAVQKWRFKPAMRNGTPVPVRAQVEVNFRLL